MCWNTSAVHVFGLCANASETPAVSARSLLSAARRSVRKSQTCRGGPYLLLAGSSVQLIFIGWLLLRTGLYELCRTDVGMKEVGGRRKLGREGGGGSARMTSTDADSGDISKCGKIIQSCFHLQERESPNCHICPYPFLPF